MKAIFIAAILAMATLVMATEPPTAPETNIIEPNQDPTDSDIVGTIQEPAQKNKKIIKKIMTRKKKPKADEKTKAAGESSETDEVKK